RLLRLGYHRWRRHLMFLACAVIIGLVSALFAVVADRAGAWFEATARSWPWAPLLITPAGFFILSWVGRTVFAGTQGSGIPQAMAARMLT
ncbi:hypothetical protein ABTL95_19700, partial [Acinetobacter baumannii]